jgi:hypothetical protein
MNRQVRFFGHGPQRIPASIPEIRKAEALRLACEEDSTKSKISASFHFGDRSVDVPKWGRSHGNEATRIRRSPVMEKIVVSPHARDLEVVVRYLQEILATKAADVRI